MMTVGSLGCTPAATAMYARLVPESARQLGVWRPVHDPQRRSRCRRSHRLDDGRPRPPGKLRAALPDQRLVIPRLPGHRRVAAPRDRLAPERPCLARIPPMAAEPGRRRRPQPPAPGWSRSCATALRFGSPGSPSSRSPSGTPRWRLVSPRMPSTWRDPDERLGGRSAPPGSSSRPARHAAWLIEGRSRTRLLAVAGLTWSLSAGRGARRASARWLGRGVRRPGAGDLRTGRDDLALIAPAIYNALAVEELCGPVQRAPVDGVDGRVDHPGRPSPGCSSARPGRLVVATVGGTLVAALGFLRLRRYLTDEQDGLAPADGPDAVSPSAPSRHRRPQPPLRPRPLRHRRGPRAERGRSTGDRQCSRILSSRRDDHRPSAPTATR